MKNNWKAFAAFVLMLAVFIMLGKLTVDASNAKYSSTDRAALCKARSEMATQTNIIERY
jgi:hypothetical protein